MIQIRRGIFETNSSSVHAICYCTEEEYNKFLNCELDFCLGCDSVDGAALQPHKDKKHYDPEMFSIADFEKIDTECEPDEEIYYALRELSDGTKFGVIKYDKYE